MRSEGLARATTSDMSVPFPPFDNKKRAFVDYTTPAVKGADLGYRILRGALTGADGVTGVMQASYRIAPLVDLNMLRKPIRSSPQVQKVRMTYYVKSNSPRSLNGIATVTPPENFLLEPERDKGFTISSARGANRRVFEVNIPSGAKGAYPVKFKIDIGGRVSEFTEYLNID